MKSLPWKAPSRIFTAAALTLFMLFSGAAAGAETKKILVAPFQINSPNVITHIRDGVQTMLISRLAWKDRIVAAELHPLADGSIQEAAALSGADYLLLGSITEFADALSIDTKVYDLMQEQFKRKEKAEKPFWMFWKDDDDQDDIRQEDPLFESGEQQKQEEKPFWKIW